jgi:hypothetical protein
MINRTHLHRTAARHWVSRQAALDAIEWEELPSLAETLRRGEFATTAGQVWSSTERMELRSIEAAPAPAPFAEPIAGLHVREIQGDEVFRHFFGDPGANH